MNDYKNKWYTHFAVVALMFLLATAIPGFAVIGILLAYLNHRDIKILKASCKSSAELAEEREKIAREISEARTQAAEIVKDASSRNMDLQKLNSDLSVQNNDLQNKIDSLHEELNLLRTQAIVEYTNLDEYKEITSEECKNKLTLIQIKESQLIKSDNAVIVSSADSKSVLNNNIKQLLRCFSSEYAIIASNVSVKNIDTLRGKLKRSFDILNKIFSTDGLCLSLQLLEIKFEALTLLYEYELKKEQEREQQRAIKEQMIEEEKIRREIEREKQKIDKEELQFKNEIDKLMKYMQKSADKIQTQLYVDKIRELEEKLKLLEIDKQNVLNREQNTRAGFVYVISNIGSFGEDVYKIGMTRRLEPLDRVKELSDASVPFGFDVHAMIFSEDAPALEALLHQTFRYTEVNKVNSRKEFFKVSLSEIEKVIKSSYNATVEFTMLATAKEYRESLRMSNAS